MPVFITHVHDEASLRMRSYLQRPAAASARAFLCRGRYSKVLNHVINVHTSESSLRWLSELQPLSKKDASTIASALILNVQEVVLQCIASVGDARGGIIRCIHLLTGDAIATNEAAARRILPHMIAFAASHGCMHACMHSYMHTYMHTYIHTYIRTYTTYIHTYVTYIHT